MGHAYIYPLDCVCLLSKVVSQQQITGFILTTLSERQTSHSKAPKATVNALVVTDFLPDLLHGATFSLSNIATM